MMDDRFSYSEGLLNEASNLIYTDHYGRHPDESAKKALAASIENLGKSERILAQSALELKKAKLAVANMDLQNLMTRFSHYTAAQHQEKAFALFWSERADVALSFPGFAYRGRAAVEGYLKGLTAKKAAKLEELKADYFGIQVSGDLLGAGFSDCLCLCTPYIIVADDGETAQGVWNLQRIAKEEVAGLEKKLEDCVYERWHLDFIFENGRWKIWHMTVREDFTELFDEDILPPGPMQLRRPRVGGDSPPGNIAMGGMPPMFGRPERGLTAPEEPAYPEPYKTFDYDMILSGVKARVKGHVGTVPEYMMHLPFTQQQDGPGGPGGPGLPKDK